MIKTAQDAYLAGRQAAMEKLAISATTGLKTTKDLPSPVRKTVEQIAPGSAPEVSYMDSYLGAGGVLAAAGLGGLGAAMLSNSKDVGAIAGAGILGAYTPTLLGAHRAKKMLEREGLSPEEINRRAPEMNAFSPIGNLGTTAAGALLGGLGGFALEQAKPGMFGSGRRGTDADIKAQGAALGGLLGLGYGLYKDYANPMNEAQRIIDEAKAAR